MTEPVAYRYENEYGSSILSKEKPHPEWDFKNVEPLYTSDQLHPRVKMTQSEFDEWNNLDFDNNLFGLLGQLLDDVVKPEYPNLTKRVYGAIGSDLEDTVNQLELCKLWIDYNQDNPEETIEIVPDMKWFVRRTLPNSGGNMLYCTDEGELTYNTSKEYATQFDTKEEAEKWTNPLTEAVHLPVEENK